MKRKPTKAPLHKHDFDSPSLPRNIGYIELQWLKLHGEGELVRLLAATALLDRLDATQVHSTTSANEELPQRPQHSFKSEDM